MRGYEISPKQMGSGPIIHSGKRMTRRNLQSNCKGNFLDRVWNHYVDSKENIEYDIPSMAVDLTTHAGRFKRGKAFCDPATCSGLPANITGRFPSDGYRQEVPAGRFNPSVSGGFARFSGVFRDIESAAAPRWEF